MIRLIIVAITVIGFLILSIPILFIEWIIGKFSPRTKEISSLRLIQGVFKLILWEAGTKVTIIGEENVPKDTPVLYIGNHRSYFDIVLSYSRCPIRTGYIAKKEMERYQKPFPLSLFYISPPSPYSHFFLKPKVQTSISKSNLLTFLHFL